MKQKLNTPYDFLKNYHKGTYKKVKLDDEYFQQLIKLYPPNDQAQMIKNKKKFIKQYKEFEKIEIPLHSQEPFSYYILHTLNSDIQDTFRKNNVNIDREVFLGTIPINKVNAGQKNFKNNQCLIVAYEGLFMFFYYMAAILASFYTKISSDDEEIEKYDMSPNAFQQSFNFNKFGHDRFIEIMKGFKKETLL